MRVVDIERVLVGRFGAGSDWEILWDFQERGRDGKRPEQEAENEDSAAMDVGNNSTIAIRIAFYHSTLDHSFGTDSFHPTLHQNQCLDFRRSEY